VVGEGACTELFSGWGGHVLNCSVVGKGHVLNCSVIWEGHVLNCSVFGEGHVLNCSVVGWGHVLNCSVANNSKYRSMELSTCLPNLSPQY